MSPSPQHREPTESRRRQRKRRRKRLAARAVHRSQPVEEALMRKSKSSTEAEEQIVFSADPLVASEKRLNDLMTSPEAPAWSRPARNEAHVTPTATVADIEARIAALDVDHGEALANLNRVQDEQRQALNDLLVQKRAAEEAEAQAASDQMPDRLRATLDAVRSYVAPTDTAAAAPTPVDDPIQRGKDALDRALRRSRGEDVPEPEYRREESAPLPASARQTALQARVAPALAAADVTAADLRAWVNSYGALIEAVHADDDDDDRYVQLRHALLEGLPTSTPLLVNQSLNLVAGLLRAARTAVTLATTMRRTITDSTAEIEKLVATVDRVGSMTSQGDHSTAYYDLERQLVSALHRLGTANADGIAALHTAARDITERLERIAALRVEYAGMPQPVVEFEHRGQTMESALEAERRTKLDSANGRQTVGADWSPFETGV